MAYHCPILSLCNLFETLYLKHLYCRQHMVGSCFLPILHEVFTFEYLFHWYLMINKVVELMMTMFNLSPNCFICYFSFFCPFFSEFTYSKEIFSCWHWRKICHILRGQNDEDWIQFLNSNQNPVNSNHENRSTLVRQL